MRKKKNAKARCSICRQVDHTASDHKGLKETDRLACTRCHLRGHTAPDCDLPALADLAGRTESMRGELHT